MIHLLDANLLIALGDANHPHRAAVLHFFEQRAVRDGWATCPLTENAFVRILGAPGYPNGAGTAGEACRLLNRLKAAPGHQFWPDDISLSDAIRFPNLPASKHLTDCYLLALAVTRGGKLATFDKGINPAWVPGGAHALVVLDSQAP